MNVRISPQSTPFTRRIPLKSSELTSIDDIQVSDLEGDINIIFHEDCQKEESILQAHWNIQTVTKWANTNRNAMSKAKQKVSVRNGRLHRYLAPGTIHTLRYARQVRVLIRNLTIRAKMPKGKGAWPVLWLMGNTETNPARCLLYCMV